MEQFNPYHKWLGVSRTETTPKPYQLLGVDNNEDDPEVIRAAAIRQSTYVRHFQSGQHAQIAARVLKEIEQAGLSRDRRHWQAGASEFASATGCFGNWVLRNSFPVHWPVKRLAEHWWNPSRSIRCS